MNDMAVITRDEELEVVKTAYFLEDRITTLKKERDALKRNRPQKPVEPQKPTKHFTKASRIPYPPINPPIDPPNNTYPQIQLPPFWKRGVYVLGAGMVLSLFSFRFFFIALLGVIGLYAGIALLIIDWRRNSEQKKRLAQEQEAARKAQEAARKAAVEAIRNSPEYQDECRRIDEQNRIRQAELDKEDHEKYLKQYEEYAFSYHNYEIALEIYETQTIPEWSQEIAELDNAIEQTYAVLKEVYGKDVVPIQYRNIPALCYLTMFLSTSKFDLKTAIERYDSYVAQTMQKRQIEIAEAQLVIGRETLRNQQYSTWLSEQIAEMTEQGNNTLKSISNWQKADIALREYRIHKARKAARRRT